MYVDFTTTTGSNHIIRNNNGVIEAYSFADKRFIPANKFERNIYRCSVKLGRVRYS